MQYLLIAYDGTDTQAEARRLKAREAHLKLAQEMKDKGKFIVGGAILNEEGKMIGSSLVCDFDSKEELDEWMKNDPYITGDVWQKIEIKEFKVAPCFLN